jgi:peptidyl-prolyl cis-trans isomerase SurA
MMGKRSVLSLLLFVSAVVFTNPFSAVWAETGNRVIAIVNNDVITLYELNSRIRQLTGADPVLLKIQNEERFKETRRKVLDLMIDEKIAAEKIKEMGISVSESELDDAVKRMRKTNRITHEQLLAGLRQRGISYEAYRKKIKTELERMKLLNLEVNSRIIIREEEIKAYYEKHKDQFKTESKVRLASIVLTQDGGKRPVEGGPLDKKAREIVDRLRKGEDFGKLARKFSRGPGAQEGGDLGYFKLEQLDPVLQRAIKNMSAGDVSEPILMGVAIQIIKVVEKQEGKLKKLDEVKNQIRQIYFRKELNKRYAAWIKRLKEKAYTKIMF